MCGELPTKSEPRKNFPRLRARQFNTFSFPTPPPQQNSLNPEDNPQHIHKEERPTPNDVNLSKAKVYIERKNKYAQYKEYQYALQLSQHFQTLIRALKESN